MVCFGEAYATVAGTALAAMQSAPVMFTPDSLHWVAATGPAKGSWNAVMIGNPNSSGTAIIRVKMPDGYTNQPHYHSHPEYDTVMQGTLLFGMGDTVNKANARVLPVGSSTSSSPSRRPSLVGRKGRYHRTGRWRRPIDEHSS